MSFCNVVPSNNFHICKYKIMHTNSYGLTMFLKAIDVGKSVQCKGVKCVYDRHSYLFHEIKSLALKY